MASTDARIGAALALAKSKPDAGAAELRRIACDARDHDDEAGFAAAAEALAGLPHLKGRASHHLFSRVFEVMYRRPPGGGARLLILREKHGDRYLDATGPDAFARSALSVLAQRLDEGWYAEGAANWPKEEGPVVRAYLDTVRSLDVVRLADPADQGLLKAWRASPAMVELSKNVTLTDLMARLRREAEAEGPRDDLFIAFLAEAAVRMSDYCQHDVAALLVASGAGPMCERVARMVPDTHAARARAVLREGAAGNLRLAGRLAFALLEERCREEYERIELQEVEAPAFDHARWAGPAVPGAP